MALFELRKVYQRTQAGMAKRLNNRGLPPIRYSSPYSARQVGRVRQTIPSNRPINQTGDEQETKCSREDQYTLAYRSLGQDVIDQQGDTVSHPPGASAKSILDSILLVNLTPDPIG